MTEPKALKDMTWEEALPIYRAFHEGKELESYATLMKFCPPITEALHINMCYRVKLTKPSVNWDHMRPEIICAARNADGELYGYEVDPRQRVGRWTAVAGDVCRLTFLFPYDPGTCHWTESLIYRPGHEPK